MTTRAINSQKTADLCDPADCTVFSDIAGDFLFVVLKPLIVQLRHFFTRSSFKDPNLGSLLVEEIVQTIFLICFAGSQDAEIFSGAAGVIMLH